LRKQIFTLIAISMTITLTASVFAVIRRNGNRREIRPNAIDRDITIVKTYDFYRVICDSAPCCEQGTYLGTVDAKTCLSLCGFQFDKDNTEYWVYDESGVEVGSRFDGVCVPVCICRPSTDGRITYSLRIKTRHPDLNQSEEPSLLTSVTLCLAATTDDYVGSDCEQIQYLEGTDIVVLPDPSMPEIGHNVILCQLYP
jgi:hypothetical protein